MQTVPLNISIRGAGKPREPGTAMGNWFGEIEYCQFWSEQLADFSRQPRVEFFTYHDRAGQSQLKDKGMTFDVLRTDLTNFYCSRFDQWVHFLYTSEPVLCCMDYNRETAFDGSVELTKIKDLYRSERYLELLRKGTGLCTSAKDFICKRCISPGG